MHDTSRTNQELLDENTFLKQRIQDLEKSEAQLSLIIEVLKKSSEIFRKAYHSNRDAINISRLVDGMYISINEGFTRLTGYSEEDVIGKTSIELNIWDDLNDRRRLVEGLKKDGEVKDLEVKFRKKNGSIIHGSMSTSVIDLAGVPHLLNVTTDITDRKRTEDALRESEEKYRLIAENSTDVIWTMSLDGRFTYVSPAVTMHAGYTQEEAMAMTIDKYMYEKDLPWVMEILYQEMQKPRGERAERRILEIRQYKKDGSVLDVEVSVAWLYDDRGEIIGLQGSTRDITARKQAEETRRKLEERLTQAQKMESIGTLAGGIAHDFNNLLMGIQGYASLMLMSLNKGHPHYEKLQAIEKQVTSGADLTRQLLGFARGGRYEVKQTDMNDLLAKAAAIFGRTRKEIRMHEKYCEDLRFVDVDRGQMDQVLLNLFVNSWQAMPGGGDLFLETDNVHLDETFVTPYEVSPGPYIKFSVTDTGVGMDEKTRQRIFDPFFTTRKMGRGTGLGLATVYGIVKGHGGMVNVDSDLGLGTKFTIYLPVSEKVKVMDKEKKAPEPMARGKETILLVDDEELVMEVTKDLLESMGYRVYVAGSGQEAVSVFMEKKNDIDLVILDMIMPGMSGGDTFDRLREIHPQIRVLLSSGYSVEGQAQQILDRGCNGFLQKPFDSEKLSSKVREMLC